LKLSDLTEISKDVIPQTLQESIVESITSSVRVRSHKGKKFTAFSHLNEVLNCEKSVKAKLQRGEFLTYSPETLDNLLDFMTVGLPIITEETLTELKEKAHIVVQEKGAEHGLDATLVLPNVIHLNYRRVEQMCNDMLRVQEFAENPKFYRTTMSWSRLKHHYGSRAKKMFAGFNIPSWAFIDSYEHDWNHLTEAEKNIRKFLDDCLTNYALNIPYYVIASADASAKKPSQEAMKHELAHALAYTNDLYFSKVQEILSKYDLSQIKKKLLTWNIYHPSVIDDEAHAYLATETPSSIYGTFHVPCKGDILKAHEEFKALLDETLSTTLLGRGHD
jgi:hypothetical protein